MKKKELLVIQKRLGKFCSIFQGDNVLAISEHKKALPFMYAICDANYKHKVLISIAVDYPNSINVALIIMNLIEISSLLLIGPFYISSQLGKKYINEEAFERWAIETLELNDIVPTCTNRH